MKNKNYRVGVFTLGCKVNSYDSEAIIEILVNQGFQIVNFTDIADIYIINTCAVTNLSEKKSRQMIRQAKKRNPKAIICVTGCLPQIDEAQILAMEEVDLLLGTQDRRYIGDYLLDFINSQPRDDNTVKSFVGNYQENRIFEPLEINKFANRQRAFIKVQEGCEQFCSYCIIPLARGPIKSRPLDSIIREVERMVLAGYEEIVLTGIHIASYGKDIKAYDNYSDGLVELLVAMEATNIKRIRLSSISPLAITDNFLDFLRESKKLCPHFHFSLQSGSNAVLERMNRQYTTEEYLEKVSKIRDIWPTVTFTTDIIVGFPGETAMEFEETKAFIQIISFLDIHIFPYSKKDNTQAALMKQVPGPIKKARAKELRAIVERDSRANMLEAVSTKERVLIEQDAGNYSVGYTSHYMPVAIDKTSDRGIVSVIIAGLIEIKKQLFLYGVIND